MNSEYVRSLRAMADYLEANPDVTLYQENFNVPLPDLKAMQEAARTHGPLEKIWGREHFILRKNFGQVNLDFYCNRSKVCQRVDIKRTVIRPKVVLVEGETEEVEITESSWECNESILNTEVS